MITEQCPFCSRNLRAKTPDQERHAAYTFECDICGRFVMDVREASMHPWSTTDASKIAAFIRRQNLLGRTPFLTRDWQRLGVSPPSGTLPCTFEDAVAAFPQTVAERLDLALLNLARRSGKPGDDVTPADVDYPLFFAEDADAMAFLVSQMVEQGWLDRAAMESTDQFGLTGSTCLTVAGWNRVAELQRAEVGSDSRQAFVAMWFSPETDVAYRDGIEPALSATGFEPRRIDLVEHTRKIDDEIIAEIRRSRFVVADFTGHRGGVYFEAGFALGLGKPVIWTCQKDDLPKTHFDTRQYNHIDWTTPEELKTRLVNRIRATIPGLE